MNKKFLAITITLFAIFGFLFAGEVQAGTEHNVSGWAWMDPDTLIGGDPVGTNLDLGWISFNRTNCDANNDGLSDGTPVGCPTAGTAIPNYGVHIDPATGNFSGYTWAGGGVNADGSLAPTIGWIRFNPSPDFNTGNYPNCPVSTCPTGSPNYPARLVDFVSKKITGWARACAGLNDDGDGVPNNCQGPTRTDGWDGWILLGPIVKGGTDFGVWINDSVSPAEFRGWAWGSDVVGWISFKGANYKVITTFSFNNPPSATNLSVDPPNSTDYCGITGYPRVRVKWQFSDPNNVPAGQDPQSAYRAEIATDSTFSNIIIRSCDPNLTDPNARCFTPPSTEVNFAFAPSPLAGYQALSWGTSYYWRVKVWDSGNLSSSWVNGPSFTTPAHSYPYPDFTLSPQNPAIGEVVTFTDYSECYSSPGNTKYNCSTTEPIGGSISYSWDFGNGQISTTKGDATTTYTTTGSKTVRLTITDNSLTPPDDCDTTRQVTVTLPLPEYKEVPPTVWLKKFFAGIINFFDGFLKI